MSPMAPMTERSENLPSVQQLMGPATPMTPVSIRQRGPFGACRMPICQYANRLICNMPTSHLSRHSFYSADDARCSRSKYTAAATVSLTSLAVPWIFALTLSHCPPNRNIVSTVNLNCKLDLKRIALHARNAEYNPKRFAAVIMRIREPRTTALIFSSGKMVCTGAKSEDDSRLAARKYARIIQKLGFSAKFLDFKIQNMVGSCDVRFPIRLEGLVLTHSNFSSYEPELFPGLIYRMVKPRIVLLIFVSGKVVLTGAKVRQEIYDAFDNIYPILKSFKKSAWDRAQFMEQNFLVVFPDLKPILLFARTIFFTFNIQSSRTHTHTHHEIMAHRRLQTSSIVPTLNGQSMLHIRLSYVD